MICFGTSLKSVLLCGSTLGFWFHIPDALKPLAMLQVFGINLGHTLERAQGLMEKFGDDFVSVEHLFLALFDDPRVGHPVLVEAGLDKTKIEEAVRVYCCTQ